jgi:hypothetical protein
MYVSKRESATQIFLALQENQLINHNNVLGSEIMDLIIATTVDVDSSIMSKLHNRSSF